MSDWQPTMNLRFVQRLDRNPPAGAQVVRTLRILQQQWRAKEPKGYGLSQEWDYEWRDVPEVEE